MTRHLEQALGLPHLDDLLQADGVFSSDDVPTPAAPQGTGSLSVPDDLLVSGRDHADKTNTIYDEAIDHARKVFDLGYNMDPARAPRAFEVAGTLMKVALDAINSKRDAQLRAKDLMLKQQKLDIERRLASGQETATIDAQAVVVEDRNELIKRLRAEAKAERGGN